MRLVKINDIILNMDRVSVIEGTRTDDKVYVYAYADDSHCIKLGSCENESDFQLFMELLYQQFQDTFKDEVISHKTEKDSKELWT